MALTGLEIYKLLPQTNCKDCDYPTCLAFAMKLAAKQVELAACPHLSEEATEKLQSASAPPIRLVELSGKDGTFKVGNETVMFRHEKTFYNKPGIFMRLKDTAETEQLVQAVKQADAFAVDYVGIDLHIDGFAVEASSGDAQAFQTAIQAVADNSEKALILITDDALLAAAGVEKTEGFRPLLHAANSDNWEAMAEVAKSGEASLAVTADSVDALADLTTKLTEIGVVNLVLDPGVRTHFDSLEQLTSLRRLALKGNFRPLGYPVITFPGADGSGDETLLAAQHISKYGSIVVLEEFDPAKLYALLVLRENIYTDPQKPIQVQPGIYEINSPDAKSPLMVTTNFSITYFSVANEVEGSGWPAWLMVTDSEGMSVLTAWAAGKFDAERIAKDAKAFAVESKVDHQKVIIPGQVAVISGELEEEMPGWEIMVGPREAVDISSYLKAMWTD
jgi:acetyl-CoA decarbonylase/synthase complex subunit gamma